MKDPIYLLSAEEYEQYKKSIPLIDELWWLRSPGCFSDYAAFVRGLSGSVDYDGHLVVVHYFAVRPALNISNLKLAVQNNRIEYLGVEWIILDTSTAIAAEPIFHSRFGVRSNNYSRSPIRRQLLNWYSDKLNQKLVKRVKIDRTGRKVEIKIGSFLQNCRSSNEIVEHNGYKRVDVLDIEKHSEINWVGSEYNRLFAKDGILYRFNNWTGNYPFTGIEMEEIGTIRDVPVLKIKNDSRLYTFSKRVMEDALDGFSVKIPKEYKDTEDFGNMTGCVQKIRDAVLSVIEAAGYSIEQGSDNQCVRL